MKIKVTLEFDTGEMASFNYRKAIKNMKFNELTEIHRVLNELTDDILKEMDARIK